MLNLASRNAGRNILMDLEHGLRALIQARFINDGIHYDSIEGQGWMNRVFQKRLEDFAFFVLFALFDTGVFRTEEATSVPAILADAPPNLETRLGSVPVLPQVLQSSIEQTEVRCIGSARRDISEEGLSRPTKVGTS